MYLGPKRMHSPVKKTDLENLDLIQEILIAGQDSMQGCVEWFNRSQYVKN
jgi:hypothetical protein